MQTGRSTHKDHSATIAELRRRLAAAGAGDEHVNTVLTLIAKPPAEIDQWGLLTLKLKRGLGRGICTMLHGPHGTGKTTIATYLMVEAIGRGLGCRYVKVAGMMRDIKAEWDVEVFNRLASVRTLIIDEVGIQFDTKAEYVTFTDLIDERYRKRLDTIMLSNMERDALQRLLGSHTNDRIIERGGYFHCNWPPKRKREDIFA